MAYTMEHRETRKVIGSVGCTYYEDLEKVGIVYFVGAQYQTLILFSWYGRNLSPLINRKIQGMSAFPALVNQPDIQFIAVGVDAEFFRVYKMCLSAKRKVNRVIAHASESELKEEMS